MIEQIALAADTTFQFGSVGFRARDKRPFRLVSCSARDISGAVGAFWVIVYLISPTNEISGAWQVSGTADGSQLTATLSTAGAALALTTTVNHDVFTGSLPVDLYVPNGYSLAVIVDALPNARLTVLVDFAP